MGRILAIDYGKKRTGIAATDVLQLSINGLPTIETPQLLSFLKEYLSSEEVEKITIGWPTHKDGNPTYLATAIEGLEKQLRTLFPEIELLRIDESYSSSEASKIILEQGIKKSKRRDKALTDKVSAMIILQRYLKSI
jgi:putative Holliday junction resolvase